MSGIKIRMTRKIFIFLVSTFLIVIIGVGFLFIQGQSGDSSTAPDKSSAICGNNIINKVNAIIEMTDYEKMESEIKNLIEEIKRKDGYKADANCINSLFVVAITDYGMLPIVEQLELLESYKDIDSKVSKEFKRRYSYGEAKDYLVRE